MITGLRLQNFRSYSDEAFEFAPGVNIIVGPNASGKTNLLEGLLMIAAGSSYRASWPAMIAHGSPWARLDAQTPTSHRLVKLNTKPAGKSYTIDGKTYQRISPAKTLPAVVFEPDHLLLLSGSPERRRNYLDELLEQTIPSYGPQRRAYQRTLAQRNRLLKQHGAAAREQIFPWDVRLGELGTAIAAARAELIRQLNGEASNLYSQLAGKKTIVKLTYQSKLPLENYGSSFLRRLNEDFELDSLRGFTGSGPHHDDVELKLHGQAAQTSASRGEVRTAVLMLKVIELRLLEDARGIKPMLLLDDVFSELDGARRHALTSFLQPYQTFITTTDADVVVQHFTKTTSIIPLNHS